MITKRRWATAANTLRAMSRWLPGIALAVGLAGTLPAQAGELLASLKLGKADTVLRGDAKCTSCHDETGKDGPKVLSIGKTKHGTVADSRTPSCVSCHGESAAHMKKNADGKRPAPERMFGKHAQTPTFEQSETCLSCHKGGKRNHWESSTHASRDVACSSCHQVHSAHDKVRDKRTQPEVCYSCHKEKRADMNKPSHHPIPEGKMTCSDCHNTHGSAGPKQLVKDTVNDTCYQCHMEKRGPFVHNHEPVSENCGNCHNPHGTTAEALLKARPPFLCHQCHTPHGGQVIQMAGQGQETTTNGFTALLGAASAGKSGINYFQGRGCLNCHTQVHGSNNPSTANVTPQFMFR